MRIAFVAPGYDPDIGGVETHVREIATRLANSGHSVDVLVHRNQPGAAATERIGPVTVRRFPVPDALQVVAFAPELWRYFIRHGDEYDIVHAHNYHAPPALAAAAAYRGPLVFTPHYHPTGRSQYRRWLHIPYRLPGAYIFHRAGRVICVSQAEAALVMRRFPLAHESIEVIPNGIDTDWLRRAEPLDELRTLLLSVGRVERYKRVHLAIDSMRYLDDRFLLAVAGTGGALPNLRRQVAEAGLQDRVLLLGSVPTSQLARLYRSAAVSLTLSEHESFSITPREALAAGARVVLSDIPVHREIQAAVGSEYAALLSTPARPADVAEAVRRLAALGPSDAEYQPSGWDDVAAATLAVYERVLSGK